MSLPKPEPPKPEEEQKPEEPPKEEEPEAEEQEEEEDEEESEIELDSDGEEIIKPKKEKKPKKEPTPPPKEPTPPPKEPTPPPKEPTPPPVELPEEPKIIKKRRNWARGLEPETESRRDSLIPTPPPEGELEAKKEPEITSDEIEKPLHIFRAHKVREFRKNADVPLEIVKRLVNHVVKTGTSTKLSCCASEGDPRIKVFWHKNGEPIETSSRVVASQTEDGFASLEIKSVETEDAGRYKCTIRIKKGEVTSECDVKVYGDDTTADDVPPTLLTPIIGEYSSFLFKNHIIYFYFGKTLQIPKWLQMSKTLHIPKF